MAVAGFPTVLFPLFTMGSFMNEDTAVPSSERVEKDRLGETAPAFPSSTLLTAAPTNQDTAVSLNEDETHLANITAVPSSERVEKARLGETAPAFPSSTLLTAAPTNQGTAVSLDEDETHLANITAVNHKTTGSHPP